MMNIFKKKEEDKPESFTKTGKYRKVEEFTLNHQGIRQRNGARTEELYMGSEGSEQWVATIPPSKK